MNRLGTGFKAVLGIVMIGVTASLAQAQSTWNALHFGMSRPEVEQALKAKGGLTVRETGPGVFSVNEPYHVELPDLTKELTFNPQLTISSKGLQQVDLLLDTKTVLKDISNIYTLADIVSESMRKALTAKYGSSIEMKGACDTVSIEMLVGTKRVQCKESWRAEGQLITVAWWWDKTEASFIYFVTYQAPSSDL